MLRDRFGRTIVAIAYQFATVQRADSIFVMGEGWLPYRAGKLRRVVLY